MNSLLDAIGQFNRTSYKHQEQPQVTPGMEDSMPPLDQNGKMTPQVEAAIVAAIQAKKHELPIWEYREASSQRSAYCPIYKCGENPQGGMNYAAYITGEINEVDKYLSLIDTLVTMTPEDSICIYIDSPGGYVSSGGLIASAIDMCRGKAYTIARGLCASAAALIHSSAKPGFASVTPFAVMLYHMSSHADSGVSTKIASNASKQVRYVNETLLSKARADGHITEEEFKKIQTGEDILVPADEWIKRTANQEKRDE